MATNTAHTAFSKVFLEGNPIPAFANVGLPDLTQMVEEYQAMGIAGAVELPKVGHFEAMVATFAFKAPWLEWERRLSYVQPVNIEVRAAITDIQPGSKVRHVPRIINMSVLRKGRSNDEIEQGREEGPEYEVAVWYYKEELDGVTIHELDPMNMIAIHNGVDLLQEVRGIIGM